MGYHTAYDMQHRRGAVLRSCAFETLEGMARIRRRYSILKRTPDEELGRTFRNLLPNTYTGWPDSAIASKVRARELEYFYRAKGIVTKDDFEARLWGFRLP